MEQIPKDVIEMAEDFFYKMSRDEVLKFSEIYRNEQTPLHSAFTGGISLLKDPNVISHCMILFLIIYKSYKYYNIQIPEISPETCDTIIINFSKYMNNKSGTFVSSNDMRNGLTGLTKQDELTHYIFINLYGDKNHPIEYKYEIDLQYGVFMLIMTILILNNEMKKHFDTDVN